VVVVAVGISGRRVGVRITIGEGVGGAGCVGDTLVAVDGRTVASVEAFPHPLNRNKMDKDNVIIFFIEDVLSSTLGYQLLQLCMNRIRSWEPKLNWITIQIS